MKSLPGLLVVLCLATAHAAEANPSVIAGTWLSGDGDGLIEIVRKGESISGHILGSATGESDRPDKDLNNPDPQLRERPLVGLQILGGFTYDGEGKWSGGQIYDPNSGNTYRCKLKLIDANTLKVRGFIGVSLLGRTETWKRQED